MSNSDLRKAMEGKMLTAQEMSDELHRFAGAKNNAPCPCGSGRKFKKCCKPKLAEWQSQAFQAGWEFGYIAACEHVIERILTCWSAMKRKRNDVD